MTIAPQSIQIPDDLRKRMEDVHGQRGRDWLNEFPNLLRACQRQWSLALDEPFSNLSFNFVVPGVAEGRTQIVLKLGVPCRELSWGCREMAHFCKGVQFAIVKSLIFCEIKLANCTA